MKDNAKEEQSGTQKAESLSEISDHNEALFV
jgi:hypothetical protein